MRISGVGENSHIVENSCDPLLRLSSVCVRICVCVSVRVYVGVCVCVCSGDSMCESKRAFVECVCVGGRGCVHMYVYVYE